MKLTNLVVLMSVAALASCASKNTVDGDVANLIRPNVSALDELKNISIEARDEIRLLAKSQEAIAQKAMTKEQHEERFFEAVHVPKGFEKITDFKYFGLPSKAAEAIALWAGYEFSTCGSSLGYENSVSIDIEKQPLNDALKELGAQTGDTIRVEVHEAESKMRFVYKNSCK